jgi:hypothetical protein
VSRGINGANFPKTSLWMLDGCALTESITYSSHDSAVSTKNKFLKTSEMSMQDTSIKVWQKLQEKLGYAQR